MRCFRCGKRIKGTGKAFVPTYRLTSLSMHIKDNCKKDNFTLEGLIDLMKVRELEDLSNEFIIDLLLKLTNFDEEKFKNDISEMVKKQWQ